MSNRWHILMKFQRFRINNNDTEVYPEPLEQKGRRYKIEFGSNSTFVTFIHLIRAMMGPTILAIPRGFRMGGYMFSPFGFLALLILVTYNARRLILMAAHLSQREKVAVRTYDEVAFVSFNSCSPKTRPYAKPLRITINLMFFFTYLDACVIFMIFMGRNMEACTRYFAPDTYLDVRYFLFFQVILLLCISTIRSLKRLAPFSLIAFILLFTVVILLLGFFFTHDPGRLSERIALGKINKIVNFVAISLFCMSGISIALTLKSSMKYPEKFLSCPAIFYISVTVFGLTFIVFGFLGYMKYGIVTQPSVMLNLPFTTFAVCTKAFAVVAVFCTCPLAFYVAFNVLWSNFLKKHFSPFNILFTEYFIRHILIIACFTTAIIVPNLGAMIVLKGALFHTHLEVTIPPILDFVTYFPEMGWGKYYFRIYWPVLMALFGFTVFVAGIVVSIVDRDFY